MLPTSEADAGCTTLYLAFLFAGRYVEASAFRLPEMAIFGQRCGQAWLGIDGQPVPAIVEKRPRVAVKLNRLQKPADYTHQVDRNPSWQES